MSQDIIENITLGICYWSAKKYGTQFCKTKKHKKHIWIDTKQLKYMIQSKIINQIKKKYYL